MNSADPLTVPPPNVQAATTPAEDAADVASPPALFDLRAHLRLWAVAGAGLVLDLWSKAWAFHTLGQGGRRVLVPHVLEFQTMLNDGALFGIGSGQTTFFVIASVLALGLVVWMFANSPARRWWLHVALGAILAGAVGNMYDRITVQLVGPLRVGGQARYFTLAASDPPRATLVEYPANRNSATVQVDRSRLEPPVGHVRDFIKIPTQFGWGELWPWVFNVADMLLVGGVSVLAVHLWFDRRPAARAVASSAG